MKIKSHLLVLACNLLFFTSNVYSQNGVGVNTNTPQSSFEDNGSFGKKITSISSATALDETHGSIICNNNAATYAVTLPAANTCAARIYEIKRNVSCTVIVTISVSGGGTIDGAASFPLNNAGQSVTVFSNGTEWFKRDGSNASTDWTITGNAGTAAATNFLGTTDQTSMVFRTNNSERARLTDTIYTSGGVSKNIGAFGVGTKSGFYYGRIAMISNNEGNGREDDLGIASFNTNPSPTLIFFSAQGSENSQSNSVTGDDVVSIFGKVKLSADSKVNTTTTIIRSNYKGNGTTNLSDLEFFTSNSRQMIIDSVGNVGIATATPTSRLHVVGSGAKTSSYAGTLLTNTATSSTNSIDKKGLEVTSIGSWTGTSANNIGIHVSSVSGGTNNYDAIFNGGGRVGIGTNNPGTKLEVVANSSGANTITSINTSSSGYSSVDYKDNSSNLKFTVGYANGSAANFAGKAYSNSYGSDFVLSKNAPSTDFFMNGSSGNIGIGNNSPQQNLSIQNGMNIDQANSNNGNTTNILTFGSSSGEGIGSKRSGGGNQNGLDFYTASTNRMAITNTGNVGVGTIAPKSTLEVNGSFAATVNTNGAATLSLTSAHYAVVSTVVSTITLPDPSTCRNRIYILTASGGDVTVNSSGNQFYNFTTTSVATFTITNGNSRTFGSDGTNWRRIQ